MDDAQSLQGMEFDQILDVELQEGQAQESANMQAHSTNSAHVVKCGRWWLAFDIGWINVLIDEFELAPVPGAAPWLIGAVNIDGAIFPVADLAAYFEPSQVPQAITRHHRLMLGGRRESSNEDAVALLFSGLPAQIEYERQPLDASLEMPERLRELCSGMADSATFEIKTDELLSTLSISLM